MEHSTRFDRVVQRVKNHPTLYLAALIVAAVIGAGEFVGSWGLISRVFVREAAISNSGDSSGLTSPACRYLLIDPYDPWTETSKTEVKHARFTLDEYKASFDGGDISSKRIFVFKGFDPGRYEFTAEMELMGAEPGFRSFVAELPFTEATFYRLKWSPETTTYGDPRRHVGVGSITETEFRRRSGDFERVLPVCSALRPGVTEL